MLSLKLHFWMDVMHLTVKWAKGFPFVVDDNLNGKNCQITSYANILFQSRIYANRNRVEKVAVTFLSNPLSCSIQFIKWMSIVSQAYKWESQKMGGATTVEEVEEEERWKCLELYLCMLTCTCTHSEHIVHLYTLHINYNSSAPIQSTHTDTRAYNKINHCD